MNPDERPSKRDAFLAFFKEGWVSVHLDARRPGVAVPPELSENPHLVLQYGRDMPLPIQDLEVTDAGISATLSFSRTPHATAIPWSAVYIVACTDGRGVLYYEDVPEEVSLMTSPVDGETGRPLDPEAFLREKPIPVPGAPVERLLRSVPAAPQDDETPTDAQPVRGPSPVPQRRRPQLKLIK